MRVKVDHGHVRVRGSDGLRELHDGDECLLPQQAPAAPSLLVPPSVNAVEPPSSGAETEKDEANRVRDTRPSGRVERERSKRWQQLAEAGDYGRAWVAMQRAPAPADEPKELLLAADVARLSHHPEQTIAPLERLLSAHPSDPRAPLAAFTLGRVLLDELGRPLAAAGAFAAVERLDAQSPLIEDALARQVEAHARAGDPDRARSTAEQYVARFPSGRRINAVRTFGGLH